MGYYRPRPSEVKSCKHCSIPFETNHKRAMYCGESCRQLAYQARHKSDQEEPRKAKGDLAFSVKNVAVTGVGALVASAVNYALNDAPFYRELDERLKTIEHKIGYQAGVDSVHQKHIADFIKAMRKELPGVDRTMHIQKHQAANLLEKRGGKGF